MPINYDDYPADWKTKIRPRILERARNHCEQCGVRDRASIRRMVGNAAVYRYWNKSDGVFLDSDRRLAAWYDQQEWSPEVDVVLTVAHIDQQVANNDEKNLAAWCQRCHLMFDQRARNLVARSLAMVESARAGSDGPDQEQAARISNRIQADRLEKKPAPKKKGRPKGSKNKPKKKGV
jgi:hypothetical protein